MKVLLPALLSLGLGGCLIVPMAPHYRDQFPSRENMDRPLEEGFPAPGTSREAVLARLGAPDESWGQVHLIYRWRKVVAEVATFGGQSIPLTKVYALEIEFDERGAVTACRQK